MPQMLWGGMLEVYANLEVSGLLLNKLIGWCFDIIDMNLNVHVCFNYMLKLIFRLFWSWVGMHDTLSIMFTFVIR